MLVYFIFKNKFHGDDSLNVTIFCACLRLLVNHRILADAQKSDVAAVVSMPLPTPHRAFCAGAQRARGDYGRFTTASSREVALGLQVLCSWAETERSPDVGLRLFRRPIPTSSEI